MTYTGTSGNLEQLAYVYDDVLNIDSLTDLADGLHDFNYDNLNRLTQAQHPTTNGLPGSENYTYDNVGNREDPNNANEYQYDNNNRITASPGLTYSFDDEGNTTGRSDGAVFTYTNENRLDTYTKGVTTASYTYDPMGRRIKKTVNGVTTWYLWDGTNLLSEYDGSGNRAKRYAYLPEGYAPIQVEDAGGLYNVHSDHLDTPKLLTDSSQNIVWRGRQKAFGQMLVDASSIVELNVRFPGQYLDVETGMHYNYFRYYDPSIGRYLTSDPIGLDGGLNTYSYANLNPLSFSDFLGLKACCNSDEEAWRVCTRRAGLRYRSCLELARKANDLSDYACLLFGKSASPLGVACDEYFRRKYKRALEICRLDYLMNLKKCDDAFLCKN